MLLDLPRMETAVAALAEFHALSSAFEQSGLDGFAQAVLGKIGSKDLKLQISCKKD